MTIFQDGIETYFQTKSGITSNEVKDTSFMERESVSEVLMGQGLPKNDFWDEVKIYLGI